MKTKHFRNLVLGVCLGCLAPSLALAQSIYEPYTFTMIAGKAGSSGNADGTNSAARFDLPAGVAADGAGNLYVTDVDNNTIRKVSLVGTNWVVTTLAGKTGSSGSADGTNSTARFLGPHGLAVDSAGNLYVADLLNHTIRKVAPVGTNWVVTTLAGRAGSSGNADGSNSTARFTEPRDLSVDSAGNLYVTDSLNHTIRKVTPVGTNWVVTTLVGRAGSSGSADGTNSAARFNYPYYAKVDGAGTLYVVDTGNHTIRKVTPVGTNWVVTTPVGKAGLAGSADGTNSAARFKFPWGVALDSAGTLYVADQDNHTIRKVTPVGTNWVVTTLAGKVGNPGSADGTGSAAQFNYPNCLAVDSAGKLYVADLVNYTIRQGVRAFAITSSGPSFGFSGGQWGFALTGPAGQAVVVDASTDLANWLPIWTNTMSVGPLQFSDPDTGVNSYRFYRARKP